MLSMRAGLNWKKRKAEIRQDARQKATIVFPRMPVDFSTFSSNADSKSSGSGFHFAGRNLFIRCAVETEFAHSQSIFGANRRSENATGHGA